MLLKEIKLQTKHLPVLFEFYKDVLELPVTQPNAGSISITVGQTELIFEATDNTVDPFYHFAFNIPSNKVEDAFQWLQDKAKLLWLDDYDSYFADFTGWHAKSVYFYDPAGNILELIARFDLKDMEQAPFSSKQFRNTSEIGLVFPGNSFDVQVNKLLHEFKIEYFPKQSPLKHFRAIGDDTGLFICVAENRNWYATDKPCGRFPLSVKFEDDNKIHSLEL